MYSSLVGCRPLFFFNSIPSHVFRHFQARAAGGAGRAGRAAGLVSDRPVIVLPVGAEGKECSGGV